MARAETLLLAMTPGTYPIHHVAHRSAAQSPAQFVELSAVALRRSTGATITFEDRRVRGISLSSLGRRWAVIDVAVSGQFGPESPADQRDDVDDALPTVESCLDVVAHHHLRRWLRGLRIDLDVPGTTCRRSISSGLGEPDGPQPLVGSHGGRVVGRIVVHARVSPNTAPTGQPIGHEVDRSAVARGSRTDGRTDGGTDGGRDGGRDGRTARGPQSGPRARQATYWSVGWAS